MSSDSSDDDNLELLREAVDNELFKSNLYDSNRRESVDLNRHVQIQKSSLRHQDEEEKNSMNVTPGMQAFLATKLMQYLDSNIKEVEVPFKRQRDKVVQGGIRLLGASSIFVSHDESSNLSRSNLKRSKKRRFAREDGSKISEEQQCREAAVSAEWILSQQAVLGWEPCTKGKVETYSQDDVDIRSNGKHENLRNETLGGKKKKRKGADERKRLKRQNEIKDLTSINVKT